VTERALALRRESRAEDDHAKDIQSQSLGEYAREIYVEADRAAKTPNKKLPD
jgi:hypothetical protein